MGGKLDTQLDEATKDVPAEVEKVGALTSTCTGCRVSEKGVIYFRFGKLEREFQDMRELRLWIERTLSQDVLDAMAAARLLKDSPDLQKLDASVGKTLSIDLVAPELVKVT